ncbi:MAG: hypothetical protein ACAI35_20870 [Candidatus Methylacidiphilales bacterium]|nr:hypothetical protein [Candidatus Methylacidiphilales bacterium]
MRTISIVVEPDADGTLRLPLPKAWLARKVRVLAIVEAVEETEEELQEEDLSHNKTSVVRQKDFADLSHERRPSTHNPILRRDPLVDVLRQAKV